MTNAPVQSLHDQIMRLPCIPPKDANVNQMLSYKYGHRAARHAAAELAAAHEAGAQQPRNSHGIDAHYFHKKLGLVLRDFDSLMPDELARSLARLAKVADDAVLSEPEFAAPPAQRSQRERELMKALRKATDYLSAYCGEEGHCQPVIEEARALIAAPSDTAAPAPQRKFSGPGHLEETGYIPAGSTAEREKATRDMWGTIERRLPEKHRNFNGPALRSALGILYDAGYHKIEGEPIPSAPEQARPRLAISSQEQLAALLNGVQALHEISAELIAECVFEQIQAANSDGDA